MNFALIGCGRIASRHANSISEIENSRLIAVCDVIESRAQHFAKEYEAKYYVDYRKLLDDKNIEIVNIATPSGFHAQMAIEALMAGKHVILEKPMAMNLDETTRIIDCINSTRQKLCVVLQNRFNPPVREAKALIDSGKIGNTLLGNATVRWYRPQEYYEDGWHGTQKMDGGALLNQSIHHIDALQWLMDKPVVSVFSYKATLAHKMEMEDAGVAVMRFEGGALGVVEGSTLTYPENLEGSVSIFGEMGSVKIGGTALNRKSIWKIEGELEHERETLMKDQLDPVNVYGTSHKAVFMDMIEAVRDDRNPKTDCYEARKSVALVQAMYESASSGAEVNLPKEIWAAA
ncbi:MAG: Gfo/Idh/MocA family oxidoreductase [Anaerolineales bacterium]|jgi:predicted dehydrogenase|nr:Gfo/Idh/MocA family oxidoreductase [Anaerolineales bacterium]